MMRALVLPIAAVLLLTGCEELLGEKTVEVRKVDPAARERVVTEVLTRISATWDEIGPEFASRLPDIKNEAARREGYADWLDFAGRLRSEDRMEDILVARRITARMNELLRTPKDDGE